jgi:YD repeat-containing protein
MTRLSWPEALRIFMVGFVTVGLITAGSGATTFWPPMRSGAFLLLRPAARAPVDHDLPASYKPVHKGHVDLGTGLYIRNDEDLVVRGTPALIVRRTYLSSDAVSRQFGIGTTHNGEWYLIGDAVRFQWAALVLPDGSRIKFERISPGMSYSNAIFEHRTTATDWQGAQLGWIGHAWALRKRDGTLIRFQDCSPGGRTSCSILETRDADGHAIWYRRNSSSQLLRIETSDRRWVAFSYDSFGRIARASASNGDEKRYEYDAGGRLVRVSGRNGQVHRYWYTPRHEMARIDQADTSIENAYDDNGRCIRQVNRFPDAADYNFDFTYHLENGAVVQTDSLESDGSWSRLKFGSEGYSVAETRGVGRTAQATITYERDSVTHGITALAVTCPDRKGRPLQHSSPVTADAAEWVERDLLQTHCFHDWRRRSPR